MVVKNVGRGEPITAFWANSLVNEVNMKQGLHLSGRSIPRPSMRNLQLASEPAFQIRYTKSGDVTLNAGQIYINGLLVGAGKADADGNVTGATDKHSYNQYSSLKDWDANSVHTMQDIEDLPEWYVVITGPKVVNSSNISEVEAKLVKQKKGTKPPVQPKENTNTGGTGSTESTTEEEEKMWCCIQLSKVVNGELLQLVSGSIFLSTAPVSLVSGDGILIESDEKGEVYKVNLYVSFIADDGIEIFEGYELGEEESSTNPENGTTEGEEKPKPHPLKVIRIKATNTPMSFIGIDGITIHDAVVNDDNNNEKRLITVEHDIKSFIGKDNIKVKEEIITCDVQDPTTGETTTVSKKCIVIQQDKPTKLSFIANDGITVTQSDEEVATTDDQGNATTEKVTVVTIGQEDNSKFSFIGIDGITVSQSEETVTTTDEQGNSVSEKVQLVTIGNENSNEYEFVGKDGVEVTTEESTTTENGKTVKKTKVTIGASVIADVDVDVRGGTNVTVDRTTEGTTQVFTVNTTTPEVEQVSIVAGDGISITHSDHTYTISCTLSGITYDFDPTWFIVTDSTVTINEAKFEEVAASVAPTVSSQITTVASTSIDQVDDCGRDGDIMLEINTTGDTASARAWTQW